MFYAVNKLERIVFTKRKQIRVLHELLSEQVIIVKLGIFILGDTVSFKPVVEAVRKEVAVLKSKGVKIIIGVGHYGYGRDKKLAAAVDGLDVLVGGHTHSFLYTGWLI